MYAQPPGKKGKGSKSKKPRTSKASSRLSTQSIATTTSEVPEVDADESMDQSTLSQATVKPKATRKGRGKGKGTKSKKEDAEVESEMDADTTELEQQPEPMMPKRAGKGKKRVSEDIANDEPEPIGGEEPEPEPSTEPPAKRRATGTRGSSVSQVYNYDSVDHGMVDAEQVDEAPQGPKKRGRKPKKATSKTRKASDVSVASQTTSKARGPRDSELEAAIQAELEADAPQPAEPEAEPEQPPASKPSKKSKKTKAVSQPETYDSKENLNDHEEYAETPVESNDVGMEEAEEPALVAKTTKVSKKKGPKKAKKEEKAKAKDSVSRESPDLKPAADEVEPENHDSFVSVEIPPQESPRQQEPEAELEVKAAAKKSSKNSEKTKKTKKIKKEPSPPPKESSPPSEPVVEEYDNQQSEDEDFATPGVMSDQVEMIEPYVDSPTPQQSQERTPIPPKTAKRYSDIPQEEHFAQSFSESQRSSSRKEPEATPRSSNRLVSPLPTAHQTPSLSPQSSDAENRPPSSHPSTSRPTILSPSKESRARTPLAATTPSPSKRNFNGGFAASNHPWTPVDIDAALFSDADDKENADLSGLFNAIKGGLSSPEKKMSVEQWVMWNAKNGEERLKRECERLVGQFEKEGGRAMRRIETIECID